MKSAVIIYCWNFLKWIKYLLLFAYNTERDIGTLLAATANSDAEIVKPKIDDGKMTNGYSSRDNNRSTFSFH
jgi:hypothetical protein